ncbi:hypothetical protein AUJ14_00730 [Candidatus Micrarchaeota archaeon CG1_02_55_22]|nr:MAG: hypothetical protein AUJ14_00730 [Candidatus Micrarchaeota archaeon CG1_02_55_22]
MAAWDKEYSRKGGLWRGTTNFALDLPKDSRVLEVGCGNGKNVSALCHRGFELYAVDSSPKAVELTERVVKQLGGEADCRAMDVRSLEFVNGFFDAVVCFHVLGHLLSDERVAAAGECVRVLKPGGKLYFKEFGLKDFRCGKGTLVEEGSFRRRTGIVTHYFSLDEAGALFTRLGLESHLFEDWSVCFRGVSYPRQELNAVFCKPRRKC